MELTLSLSSSTKGDSLRYSPVAEKETKRDNIRHDDLHTVNINQRMAPCLFLQVNEHWRTMSPFLQRVVNYTVK